MQDFEEQERRLMAALGRLGAGIERLSEPPAAAVLEGAEAQDSAAEVEIARLSQLLDKAQAEQIESEARAALARERQAQTQATLQAQLEAASARLEAVTSKLEAATGQLEAQAADLQQQREVNAQLREALHALRGALAQGEVGVDGINMALAAEVAELRAARASEAREVAALLNGIDPLIAPSASPAPAAAEDAPQQIVTEETDDARA